MNKTFHYLCFLFFSLLVVSCSNNPSQENQQIDRYDFPNIIDIGLTPSETPHNAGCFSDAGSWMGFTIPQPTNWINGFCGPFSIDHRIWFAQSIVEVGFKDKKETFTPDSTNYYPGEICLSASSQSGTIQQRMNFINEETALLQVTSDSKLGFSFRSNGLDKHTRTILTSHDVTFIHENGEVIRVMFQKDVNVLIDVNTDQGNASKQQSNTQEQSNTQKQSNIHQEDNGYQATTSDNCSQTYITISFYPSIEEAVKGIRHSQAILDNPQKYQKDNRERWNSYLSRVLRNDMEYKYDRIAVKAIVTLISNWQCKREDLLHEGIIPSHAVHYFIGFWSWDCWRFSAALAQFSPELAKNNMRAMFDYQQSDGMIVDCVYTDSTKNNRRDTKPPLACWAVDEIFTHNADTAFVKEMYPKLLSYYKWWYKKRDHDHNGMCEFGSTDGTLEAAAWESGMDNAIRFDDAQMLKNGTDAWSVDQESVDLNSYLALECKLLKKFAQILDIPFDGPDYSDKVADYFFNPSTNFFGDRKLKDRKFISDMGCEGYTPFWTQIASREQMEKALPILMDSTKFSTYIPFPTAAADNPKCNSDGYWRGPIWLDQTYFAIKGLRNYGYNDLADQYTLQVFDRLEGLTGNAPIHENYGTHTGKRLQAPHFSWSSSHLLMMYSDFGR